MKAPKLLYVMLALLVISVPASAATAPILAQYDIFNSTGTWSHDVFITNYIIAETFKVDTAGVVGSVDGTWEAVGAPTTPLKVEVRSTYRSLANGLQPDMSANGLLYSGTIGWESMSSDPIWANCLVNPVKLVGGNPVVLQTGTDYAVVCTAAGTNSVYRWHDKNGGWDYPGRHLV